MLKRAIRTTLPFYSDTNNQYFRKVQCDRECIYGTITDKFHLPPFIIVRETRVDNIDITIQCLDDTLPITVNPFLAFNCIRFVNSDEKAIIEGFTLTVGDTYYIDTVGIIVNGWETNQGKTAKWNGATWIYSEIITLAQIGDFIKESQLNIVYVWNGIQWIETVNGLQVVTIEGFDYICYNGFALSTELPCGYRYLIVEDSVESFYSEVLDIRDFDYDNNEYHKLIITSSCNLANIPYKLFVEFVQYFYFEKDALVGTPEYQTEEQTEKDGFGNELVTFQRQVKLQLLETLLIPEYIVDWLNFVMMHDTKKIKLPNTTVENNIDNYEIDTSWESIGCYANSVIKFSDEENLINSGCCTGVDLTCKLPLMTIIDVVDVGNRFAIESAVPTIGDSYIIQGNVTLIPSDIWLTNEKKIAKWNGIDWDYIVPNELEYYFVIGQNKNMVYISNFAPYIVDLWVYYPYLIINYLSPTIVSLIAYILPGSFGRLFVRNTDTGIITNLGDHSISELSFGVSFNLIPCEHFEFWCIPKTGNNCVYLDGNHELADYEDCVCLGTC